MIVLAQSEFIEPGSPQAAQLGIHFLIIALSQHTVLDGPPFCLRTLHWRRKLGRDRRRKKPSTRASNPQPQEFCSTDVCSTAVLQPQPILAKMMKCGLGQLSRRIRH